jgi:undecaprenyl-diphosphatase
MNRAAIAFLVCLVGFGLLARLASQPGIPPIDAASTAFLHGLSSSTLDTLMDATTLLGSSPVLTAVVGLVVVLLVLRRRSMEAVFLVIALVGTLVLNDGLKQLVQRPRPGFDWAEVWPETGFPSGHSMNSFVVYFAIALVTWHVWGRRRGIVALILATALTISVGISRIYLGAHWPSDVIGGYLAGTLWLLLLAAAWASVSRSRSGGRHDAPSGDAEVRPVPARRAR